MQHFRVSENKIVVAYPGVDPLYYQSCVLQSTNHEERRQKYFVFVGTFTARKNLESVVRAFATIAEEVEEELVVVAYWDPERGGKLKSLAEQLGVLPRIKFVSGLSGPELANLYRNATAAILLSEYEGFGYPAAEAMACGTPVIVSDSTSLAEVTADAALKVSCHDITGAANAMLRLASDETVRRELSSAGKQRATLFTCERFAQALHAGIEDALR